MTAWKEVTQKVSDRVRYGITKLLVVRQLRLRQRLLKKSASQSKGKGKKQISPQEAVALIASIIIIIIAFGGMGLVYSMFP
jgi:hypothetical protein